MISFKEGSNKFNFRAGAIIVSGDKKRVLLHTIKGYNFYLLPGCRVEWLEDSVSAIRRELKEELGLENITLRLRLNLESFFNFNEINYHEISNNFVVELDDRHKFLEEYDEFLGVEGENYIFKWVPFDELDSQIMKPNYLKEVIKNYQEGFEYKILNDK